MTYYIIHSGGNVYQVWSTSGVYCGRFSSRANAQAHIYLLQKEQEQQQDG